MARALAVLDGREYVLPEDVKECAVAALAHRLTLRAETWSSGVTGAQVVTELLDQVPGPATTRPTGMTTRSPSAFQARAGRARTGWRRTDALVRAVVCGLGLLVVGLVLHRLELVLIGMPLVHRPAARAAAGRHADRACRRAADTVDAGRPTPSRLTVAPGEGAAFTALRMPLPGTPGVGPVHLLPAAAGEVRTQVAWNAWGHGIYLRPDHLFASQDGLYVYGPVVGVGHAAHRAAADRAAAARPAAAARGRAGRRAPLGPRPGDGMELRDIRPFQSGDRLRRVDWRVSLRAAAAAGGTLAPGTLHVRERHAEADADLVLALDTRLDVGREVGGVERAADRRGGAAGRQPRPRGARGQHPRRRRSCGTATGSGSSTSATRAAACRSGPAAASCSGSATSWCTPRAGSAAAATRCCTRRRCRPARRSWCCPRSSTTSWWS